MQNYNNQLNDLLGICFFHFQYLIIYKIFNKKITIILIKIFIY
jgi:hypothetical protein